MTTKSRQRIPAPTGGLSLPVAATTIQSCGATRRDSKERVGSRALNGSPRANSLRVRETEKGVDARLNDGQRDWLNRLPGAAGTVPKTHSLYLPRSARCCIPDSNPVCLMGAAPDRL